MRFPIANFPDLNIHLLSSFLFLPAEGFLNVFGKFIKWFHSYISVFRIKNT